MLAKVGIAIGAPFLLMAIVVGATGVVVVDVKEGGADGHHFVIPVPLILAQAALNFAPEEAQYVECEEFGPYQDLAIKVLEELKNVPDATLVEVQSRSESVLIRKSGDELLIDVESGSDIVYCRVPLKSAIKMVKSFDGKGFNTSEAIAGLRRARLGTLVHVQSGDDEVKIRMF